MGWKIYSIIVQGQGKSDFQDVINKLNLTSFQLKGESYFESALNPSSGHLYIGDVKSNLVIFHPEIPMTFLEPEVLEHEKLLNNLFPDSEICALILNSTVNLWGFSISKAGQKIRVKGGAASLGTMVDKGDIQEEEKELLERSQINENGERMYRFPRHPEEEYSEAQVGEEFVFELSKRFFKVRFSTAEIMETTVNHYQK